MATKRQRINRTPQSRVTAEAVTAYRARDWLALHRALRLRPWEASPLDATTEEAPDGNRATWEQARELRAQLEASHGH